MTDHSDPRDKIIARLAAQSLRAGTQVGSACPDPELLAAYADRALSADETREWETHFSACPKCQKLLGLLAVSAQEAPPQQEAALQSKSPIAFSPPTTTRAGQSPARQSHWSKHLLVPVLGAAAVLTLWLALRPALTPTQTAEVDRTAAPASAGPNSAIASPPPKNEIAQADIPPPPAASAPRGSQTAEAIDQAKQVQRNGQAATASRPAAGGTIAGPALQQQASPPSDQDSARLSASGDRALAAPQALSRPGNSEQSAQNQATPNTPAVSQLPVLSRRYQAPAASAPVNQPAPRPAAPSGLGVAGLGGAAPSSFSNQTVAGLAKAVAPGVTFAAVDGPMWRVGPTGNIERSSDKGTTWQPQSSGVKADLLAGTAVSDQVAWVVGREGVILRTTDGETWQRVASPNRLMVDWTNIQATDADHASINSSDHRSFRTEDGGKTWTTQ